MSYSSVPTVRTRHPIATSVALAVVLAVVLGWLVAVLPLRGNDAHAAFHLAVAVPVLLLLTLAIRAWPPPAGRAEALSRGGFPLGLGLVGDGMCLEAIGAYGYEEDGGRRIEALTTLHNAAVAPGGIGLLLTGSRRDPHRGNPSHRPPRAGAIRVPDRRSGRGPGRRRGLLRCGVLFGL